MQRKIYTSAAIVLVAFQFSFADYWVQKANFGGAVRSDATGFAIGSYGYIGTGYANGYSTDFWKYDQAANSWTQVASFGGNPGVEMSAFVIGNRGYVLPAPSGTDFWEYNPVANSWSQKAVFPGGQRQAAVSFTINGKGYITTGYGTTYFGDLWEYDANANSWLQKANFAGAARFYACGFAIGNKGYIGTGTSSASITMNDFWEYDPAGDVWTQKSNVPGSPRYESVGFSLGAYGYICGGYTLPPDDDLYQYDPVGNSWAPKASFGGGPRVEAVAFSINSFGYLGTGWDGLNFRNDFWEYHIDSTTSVNSIADVQFELKVFPNPVVDHATILLDEKTDIMQAAIKVSDMAGREVISQPVNSLKITIDASVLAKGQYVITLFSKNRAVSSKKILVTG